MILAGRNQEGWLTDDIIDKILQFVTRDHSNVSAMSFFIVMSIKMRQSELYEQFINDDDLKAKEMLLLPISDKNQTMALDLTGLCWFL